MQKSLNVLNYFRHLTSSKLLVAILFVIALTVTSAGAIVYSSINANAASCTANDIIRCGVTNGTDFKSKYYQNEAGDLYDIYLHYDIDPTHVQRRGVEGTINRDGTIKVGNRTVATDAKSLGRSQKSYSTPVTISGKTYHESRSQDVLAQSSLPVLVVMDENDRFQYAIIKDCANPATGKPTPPPAKPVAVTPEPPVRETPTRPQQARYSCTGIDAIRVDDGGAGSGERTYRFEVTYVAENAELRDVTFEIKGHEDQVVEPTDDSDTISTTEVTFDTPGSKYVRAILHFDVNGQIKDRTSNKCAMRVQIPAEDEITICRDGNIITIPESQRRDDDKPEGSADCNEPVTTPVSTKSEPGLPSTGPAEAIGGTLGVAGIIGGALYLRNSRRRLIDSSIAR